MNDKLKNYTSQPDPEVWESIEKTLRRRAMRRYAATGVMSLVLLAAVIVGVVSWPSQKAGTDDGRVVAMADQMGSAAVRDAAAEQVRSEAVKASAPRESDKSLRGTAVAQQPQAERQLLAENSLPQTDVAPKDPQPVEAVRTQSKSVKPSQVSQVAPLVVEQPIAEEKGQPNASVSHIAQPECAIASEPKPAAVKTSSHSRAEDTILWIPNAFMPASDDASIAIFRPRVTVPDAAISNYKMTIFNRGGHVVYTSRDINQGWDGTYRGEEQVQAAYVYVIQYTDQDKVQHQSRGTVTLIR